MENNSSWPWSLIRKSDPAVGQRGCEGGAPFVSAGCGATCNLQSGFIYPRSFPYRDNSSLNDNHNNNYYNNNNDFDLLIFLIGHFSYFIEGIIE